MREKKSGLWWYLPAFWFVFLLFFSIGKKIYMENVMYRMLAIYISFWKLTFVVMLLSSFVCMRQYRKNTRGYLGILMGIMFMEILYCVGLLLFLFCSGKNMSADILLLFFKRILYAHGISGFLGIIFGTVLAKTMNGRMAYVCVAAVAVCCSDFIPSYNNYYVTNSYHPYPVEGIFQLSTGTFFGVNQGGLFPVDANRGDTTQCNPNTEIKTLQMEIWLNQKNLLEERAELELETHNSDEMVFELNRIMVVDSVSDADGNPLEWEQKGDYLCVKSVCNKIFVHLYCNQVGKIAIDGAYASLPAYVRYYPVGMENCCNYRVVVHGKGTIYSNLEQTGKNVFEGYESGISLLGGELIGEEKIGDIRIIYPTFLYESEEIKNLYKYKIVVNVKDGLAGKDWFVDNMLGNYYGNCAWKEEQQKEDYFFSDGG